MSDLKPQDYRLPDKYDHVEFTGTLIGESSTETPESTRWTEIRIYRTTGGKYVIYRIGRSVLFHRHDGVCNTGVARQVKDLELDDEIAVPCSKCRPGELDDLEDTDVVDEELDKHAVTVCDADDVYRQLLLKRRDDTTFMSQPARRALEMAVLADPHLALNVGTTRKVS